MKANVLFCMLVPLVPQWVTEDVMQTPFVPAFVRVVSTKCQGHTVPRSPQDRIIIGHILVDPSDVALRCLVLIVVITDGVQKPGVLEVYA